MIREELALVKQNGTWKPRRKKGWSGLFLPSKWVKLLVLLIKFNFFDCSELIRVQFYFILLAVRVDPVRLLYLPFCNFYTPHLRWNSTTYHTELGQNAVFHNFLRQIALSQYSGRARPFKNFRKFPKSPIRPAGSRFYSASCQCGRVFEWTLRELRFNIIANLLLFVLLFNGFSYNDV